MDNRPVYFTHPPHNVENTPAWNARFGDVLVFATQLHSLQRRKGANTPYIAHLLGTAALVMEAHGTEEEACAALLHDAAEDQGGREVLITIAQRFGSEVARIVEACSDSLETPKPAWRPRKEAYIAHLYADADPSIRLVTLADKVYNAESIVDAACTCGIHIYERFTGRMEGTKWYYNALLDFFNSADHPRELALRQRFARAVALLP